MKLYVCTNTVLSYFLLFSITIDTSNQFCAESNDSTECFQLSTFLHSHPPPTQLIHTHTPFFYWLESNYIIHLHVHVDKICSFHIFAVVSASNLKTFQSAGESTVAHTYNQRD